MTSGVLPVPPAVMLPTTITGTGAFQVAEDAGAVERAAKGGGGAEDERERQEDERPAAEALPFPFEPGTHSRSARRAYLRDWVVKEMWL